MCRHRISCNSCNLILIPAIQLSNFKWVCNLYHFYLWLIWYMFNRNANYCSFCYLDIWTRKIGKILWYNNQWNFILQKMKIEMACWKSFSTQMSIHLIRKKSYSLILNDASKSVAAATFYGVCSISLNFLNKVWLVFHKSRL